MRINQGRRWGQALDFWGLIRWKVKHCICLHCLDEVSWLREEAGLGLSREQPQKITSRSMSWPTEETTRDQTDGTIRLGDQATKRRASGSKGLVGRLQTQVAQTHIVDKLVETKLEPMSAIPKAMCFPKGYVATQPWEKRDGKPSVSASRMGCSLPDSGC